MPYSFPKNLGNPFDIIPIQPVYESFLSTLKPVFKDLPFSVAEENIQSRSRGNLLMAIANKFGYILLNTSNKSELATGYGTLYGDMAGGLSVLGDIYKIQVYALARYMNRDKEIIPVNILDKSALCRTAARSERQRQPAGIRNPRQNLISLYRKKTRVPKRSLPWASTRPS